MARWDYTPPTKFPWCTHAKCVGPADGSSYYGQFENGQPHGLGAHYAEDRHYIEGGEWEEGVLVTSVKKEVYEKAMLDLEAGREYYLSD